MCQAFVPVRRVSDQAVQTPQRILPLWAPGIGDQVQKRASKFRVGDDDLKVLHGFQIIAVCPSRQFDGGRIDDIGEEVLGHG